MISFSLIKHGWINCHIIALRKRYLRNTFFLFSYDLVYYNLTGYLPEPDRSTLYLSTICKVLGLYSSTFLGNLQYLYLYLSTFQLYFDFQVLLEYI